MNTQEFNDAVFQCQIGTGKVTYYLNDIDNYPWFQCQIGTGKVKQVGEYQSSAI